MSPQPPVPEPLWHTVPPEAQAAILAAFTSLERRIAELEAEVGIYQDKADRAEQWLHKVYTEIEDRFLRQDNGRRGVTGAPQRRQGAKTA